MPIERSSDQPVTISQIKENLKEAMSGGISNLPAGQSAAYRILKF